MPLNDDDLTWLVRQLAATAELLGQELKPNAAALLADDLSVYDRPLLAAALQRVRSEHTGRLTPKAIIDRIDELAGRPAANEAWALASQALDERVTVVWTGEMSEAWSVAQPLAAAGDMVGARMAFIATYERLVRAARDERRMPQTWVSLGWDTSARAAAVEQARARGYITAARAAEMLPAPEPKPGFNPVALLAGRVEVTEGAVPEVRQRLAVLRAELAAKDEARHQGRQQAKLSAARDLAERKAQAQRMVDERLAAQGGQAA